MGICSAEGCANKSYKDCMLSFHSFPLEDPVRLKKWLQAINKESWTPKKEHRVCSEHFQPDDFRSSGKRKRLRKEAIPCLNLQKSNVENSSDQNTSHNTSAKKNSNIICIAEKPDKNVTLKMALSQYSTNLGESSTSNVNESKKLIKPDMKNLVQVNLLGNLKSKANVKMILCKRSSIDPGASGCSNVKSIENIAGDSRMLLSSIKMSPKQEVARLRAINEELVKKVKALEKLVPINEKLTERMKYLEKLVQDLQIKNKVETKIEEESSAIMPSQKLKSQMVGFPRTEISVYSLQKYVDSDHCYSSSPKTLKRKLSVGLEGLREKKKKINTWQRRISRSAIKHEKIKRIVKDSPD